MMYATVKATAAIFRVYTDKEASLEDKLTALKELSEYAQELLSQGEKDIERRETRS